MLLCKLKLKYIRQWFKLDDLCAYITIKLYVFYLFLNDF